MLVKERGVESCGDWCKVMGRFKCLPG